MDSQGRVWEFVETEGGTKAVPPGPVLVTGEAMPAACRPKFVLAAMDALADIEGEVSVAHVALAPLTPFERGWVLGVRAARTARRRNG
jgi:hypothetical protein